ncbi:hypothetical protein [Salinispora pacifica]|uniref:hypothetical protein n=1 Tax=Salinispora pacifica TaxID=351187 RepID=UPI0009B7DE0C
MNVCGDIVGASPNTAAVVHAALWRSGTVRDLGTLGGGYAERRHQRPRGHRRVRLRVC